MLKTSYIISTMLINHYQVTVFTIPNDDSPYDYTVTFQAVDTTSPHDDCYVGTMDDLPQWLTQSTPEQVKEKGWEELYTKLTQQTYELLVEQYGEQSLGDEGSALYNLMYLIGVPCEE